ncbi:MAG: hypothetical protein AAB424_02970 [Patescibacteria group bacterium]
MDQHIGENGTLIARITHDDPEAIEEYVKALRIHAKTPHIDWFYIVNTIAVVKAIGDLPQLRLRAKEVFPPNCSIPLHLVV